MGASGMQMQEYSASAEARFRADGRLFLADYSKNQASRVLRSLLVSHRDQSILLVAEDPASAEDYAVTIRDTFGEVTVVDSYKAFAELAEIPAKPSSAALRSAAPRLLSRASHLVIAARDKAGEPLLHRILCRDDASVEHSGGNVVSDFCISDMLAECGYHIVVLDQVYTLFTLIEGSGSEAKDLTAYPPGQYDCLDFLGTYYYSDATHSYHRLRDLAASAQKRIVLSDMVAHNSTAAYYAVLHMVYADFSLYQLKKTLRKVSPDYDSDRSAVYISLNFAIGEDSTISGCLHETYATPGHIPSDIPSMMRYLRHRLAYQTEDEIYLRLLLAFSQHTHTPFPPQNIYSVIERLQIDPHAMVSCICRYFFSDAIKGRMETCVSQDAITGLSGEQLTTLFDLFLERGVYHAFSPEDAKTAILRFKRDNSGFEHFIRHHSPSMLEDNLTYSVISTGTDLLYKCIALAQFLEGHDDTCRIKDPLLVITRDVETTVRTLTALLPNSYRVSSNLRSLVGATAGSHVIAVCTLETIRAAAAQLSMASAVVFDAPADPVLTKLLLQQLVAYQASPFIFTAYSDYTGHMLDQWQKTLLAPAVALPFNTTAVPLLNRTMVPYSTMFHDIATAYAHIGKALAGGTRQDAQNATDAIHHLMSTYSLTILFPLADLESDLRFLSDVSKSYEAIFTHTTAVGDHGEIVVHNEYGYSKTYKGKKEIIADSVETKKTRRQYFNACAKMLRHDCDLKTHNCADCPEYALHMENDFSQLSKQVERFFELSQAYYTQTENTLQKRHNEAVIKNEMTLKLLNAVIEARQKLDSRRETATNAIRDIARVAEAFPALFMVEYNPVAGIRDSVFAVYNQVLEKYYMYVCGLFEQATQTAISGYNSMSACTTAHKD